MHTVVFTACVHGRPWPCTDLVHGHARTVYIAVYTVNGRVHGLYTGKTAVNGHVLSANTPVNTVHGRVDRP